MVFDVLSIMFGFGEEEIIVATTFLEVQLKAMEGMVQRLLDRSLNNRQGDTMDEESVDSSGSGGRFQ